MDIVIITEGGGEKGIGHIMRCVSIKQALNEKNIFPRMIIDTETPLNLSGLKYENIRWLENENTLLQTLSKTDICIIDSYRASIDLYENISKNVNLAVYFDDNERITYPSGVIINGAISADNLHYKDDYKQKFLLGSNYTPLRKTFWNVPERISSENINKILITMGGSDPHVLTFRILEILQGAFPEKEKIVIIGPSFNNEKKLLEKKEKRTTFYSSPSSKEMKKIFSEVDIAISATGQTLYELARMGVPTIGILCAKNQELNVTGWKDKGFLQFVGSYDDDNLMNNILELLKSLEKKEKREKLSIIGQKTINGQGARRIVREILHSLLLKKSIIRKAEERDLLDIYKISNDSVVREYSFNSKKIELESHKKWFSNKLRDKNCLYFVYEDIIDKEIIGQIRFDIRKKNAEISISLSPKYRRLGLGKVFVVKTLEKIKRVNLDIENIIAFVKPVNQLSIKFFLDLGFIFQREELIEGNKAHMYKMKLQ